MLTYNSKIYYWNGSLSDLKCFVEKTLNLKGSWNSPGGDVKLFCSTGSKFVLKWYGSKSQKLVIQANHTHYLQQQFASLITTSKDNSANNTKGNNTINNDSMTANILEECNCSCSCTNKLVTAEIEGVKLDMTILESRILAQVSQNEVDSDINSLRSKLKDLEAVMRHQEKAISILNKENQFFKARLLSLENALL